MTEFIFKKQDHGDQRDHHAHAEEQEAVRLDGGKRRWPICQTDGSDKTTQAQIAQRLQRGRWESTNIWPVRTDSTRKRARRSAHRLRRQASMRPTQPGG